MLEQLPTFLNLYMILIIQLHDMWGSKYITFKCIHRTHSTIMHNYKLLELISKLDVNEHCPGCHPVQWDKTLTRPTTLNVRSESIRQTSDHLFFLCPFSRLIKLTTSLCAWYMCTNLLLESLFLKTTLDPLFNYTYSPPWKLFPTKHLSHRDCRETLEENRRK